MIDTLMRFLPFTEEQLHRVFLVAILAGAAALTPAVTATGFARTPRTARAAATAAPRPVRVAPMVDAPAP